MPFCSTVIIALLLLSCSNTSKLVLKTNSGGNKIRFFKTDTTKHTKQLKNLYAKVDSSNVRIDYSFFNNDINKTYNNDHNLRYVLTSDKKPMSPLTIIDSVVLKKADLLMDSLNFKNLKRATGATGYYIEVLKTPL